MDRLNVLAEGQREHGNGSIGDPKSFEGFWATFKPGEFLPEIDFRTHLVLFTRNTRFFNRISIGWVKAKNGVAEVLAMETMSAMPIEDKLAMSPAVVPRNGIQALNTDDKVIPIEK